MKWYDSFKYKPKNGAPIFVWDMSKEKYSLINANWNPDEWYPQAVYPFWSYVLDGFEPVLINNKEISDDCTCECHFYCNNI